MTEPTLLDLAYASPDADEPSRRRFYALLLETTLFAPVHEAPETEPLRPRVFELSEGPIALAFDRDDRAAEFFGRPVPYAALQGRDLIDASAERGLGLGVNLGASSATLLGAEAVAWLAANAAASVSGEPVGAGSAIAPPAGAAEAAALALGREAERWPGVIAELWLVRVRAAGETRGGLVAIARPGAAAAAAEKGIAARLGAAAAPFAEADEPIAIAIVREGDAALAAARRQGARLAPLDRSDPAPPPAPPPQGPPRLR